jgi:hypothetical protein
MSGFTFLRADDLWTSLARFGDNTLMDGLRLKRGMVASYNVINEV